MDDDALVRALVARYGIAVGSMEVPEGGIDPLAHKRVARTADGEAYFVKLTPTVDRARLRAVRALFDGGLCAAVPPLPDARDRLSSRLGDLDLVLYPFVDGVSAIRAGLADEQWIAYGRFVRALHDTELPVKVREELPVEQFDGEGAGLIRRADDDLAPDRDHDDAVTASLADIWRSNRPTIIRAVQRAEGLRARISARADAPQLVPCHSDIHVGNVLVTPDGGLRIVDWDDLRLAPRERDLKFFLGARIGSFVVGDRDTQRFLEGYGPYQIDEELLSWYREEWLVIDIGEYARTALFLDGLSPETRADAVEGLRNLLG
jgi:spectinomycin phosphotransferase